MADIVTPYVKDKDGKLLPVGVIYDKDGNDITAHYQKDTGLCLSKDSEGYVIVVENK